MRFRSVVATVVIFAVAMAYMELAVVVYLQRALGITPDSLFPLRNGRWLATWRRSRWAGSSRRW